jgi:hypothetical protein
MKRICISLVFTLLGFYSQGQFNASSNIVVADTTANRVQLGSAYEFNNIQAQLIYNINNRVFGFSSFYFDNSASTSSGSILLFADEEEQFNDNVGFNIGLGIHGPSLFKSSIRTEWLLGYDFQQNNVLKKSFINNIEINDIRNQTTVNQYFTQVNFVKVGEKWDHAFSLKLAYLKVQDWKVDSVTVPNEELNSGIFSFTPAYHINYKPFKSVFFQAQMGFNSISYENYDFNNDRLTVSEARFNSLILKLGVVVRL